MKKIFLILALGLISSFAMTQEATETIKKNSTKMKQTLPEKGDFAIGIDATPFFNYIGTMFRITEGTQNAPSFNFMNGTMISGKYQITDSKAVRAGFRIGLNSKDDKNMILDDAGDIGDYVTDSRTQTSTDFSLSAGLEYSRGKGRLQGYYGFEAIIGFSSQNTTYEYGNAYSTDFPHPLHTTQWEPYIITGTSSERILSKKSGISILMGAQAFVGVEYFFAKKMSLGGEFGWGPAFLLRGDQSTEMESYDTSSNSLDTHTIEKKQGNEFSMDTRNANGKISLMFYF